MEHEYELLKIVERQLRFTRIIRSIDVGYVVPSTASAKQASKVMQILRN